MKKLSAKVNPKGSSGFFGTVKNTLKGGWNTLKGKNIDEAKSLRDRNLNRARKVVLESANKGADDATMAKKWDKLDSIKDKLDGKVKKEQALHNVANVGVAGAVGYGMYSGMKDQAAKGYEQDKTASEAQMQYESYPETNPSKNSYSNTQDYYDYQELASAETKNIPDRTNLPIYDNVLKTAKILDLDKNVVNYMLNTISGVNVKTASKGKFNTLGVSPAQRILGSAIIAGAAGLGTNQLMKSDMDFNDMLNFNHYNGTVPDSYNIIPYHRY